MNPMSTFDPSKPAMVHDRLNDRTFQWKPKTMQANYEQYASLVRTTGRHRLGRPLAGRLVAEIEGRSAASSPIKLTVSVVGTDSASAEMDQAAAHAPR